MKDLFALKLYTRVARLGSFSAAARELDLSQSQASRIIADLEAGLGTRLLSRTTRAVVPNEAGAEYLARIEPILDALEEADQGLRGDGSLRGVLRVGMPTSFALRNVIPRLSAFVDSHPDLRLQILMEDKRQDLVREGVDVAIRVGTLTDSTATAKMIGTMPRVAVAAPGYLKRMGTPAVPADLVRHRIIGGPASFVPNAWTFQRDGIASTVELQTHVLMSDNEGAVAAAVAGLGVTSTTKWACRRELDDGSLVRLLVAWTMAEIAAHAYYPAGRAARTAARAFVDFLIAEMRADPAYTTR